MYNTGTAPTRRLSFPHSPAQVFISTSLAGRDDGPCCNTTKSHLPLAKASRDTVLFQWSSRLNPPGVTAPADTVTPPAAAMAVTRPGMSFPAVKLLPRNRTRTVGPFVGGNA